MQLRKRLSEPGFVVSLVVHAAALGATLVAFSHNQSFDDVQETVPVEMVTNAEFNQIMRGEKSAKEVRPEAVAKAEKVDDVVATKPNPPTPDQSKDVPSPPPPPPPPPLPPVRQAEPPKPAPPQQVAVLPPPRPEPPEPELAPPPVPTPPIREADAEPMLPKPIPKPKPTPPKLVAKPVPVPPRPEVPKVHEAKLTPPPPKPRPPDPPKVPDPPKPDLLARLMSELPTDLLPSAKPSVSKPRVPDTSDAGKFDPTDISRLLSREAPAQRASTAHDTSRVASLGSPTANANKMSPSLWGALDGILEDQYRQCWSYLGLSGQTKYIPQVRVVFAPGGSLQAEPILINPPSDPALQNLADSALRAVRRCNPLKIPEQYAPYYDQWKGRVLRFDPDEMAG